MQALIPDNKVAMPRLYIIPGPLLSDVPRALGYIIPGPLLSGPGSSVYEKCL